MNEKEECDIAINNYRDVVCTHENSQRKIFITATMKDYIYQQRCTQLRL